VYWFVTADPIVDLILGTYVLMMVGYEYGYDDEMKNEYEIVLTTMDVIGK
jgi:hypothetical protein